MMYTVLRRYRCKKILNILRSWDEAVEIGLKLWYPSAI
jgi:hypothetical protein